MQFQILRVEAAVATDRAGDNGALCLFQHPVGIAVINVHNCLAAALEEHCLGIAVCIHGLVEIQMVFRQIGKCCHVKLHAAHAVQRQRMGRHFHHHMGATSIPHPGKQALQFEAFGGRTLGRDMLITDHVSHGAYKAHLGVQRLFQHLLQQQGDGSLAVGTGDTDEGHALSRRTVIIDANKGQRQTVRLHQHIGNIHQRFLCRHHNRRALGHGHGDETVAVRGKACNGHKQATGLHLPGVIGNIRDFRFRVSAQLQHPDSLQKFFQFHDVLLPCPF